MKAEYFEKGVVYGIQIMLICCALIHLLPGLLFFLPGKIENAYGLSRIDQSSLLLLRHRSFLFFILAICMLSSAFLKRSMDQVALVALASMISFVILYFRSTIDSPVMIRVVIADIVLSILLGILLFINGLIKAWRVVQML